MFCRVCKLFPFLSWLLHFFVLLCLQSAALFMTARPPLPKAPPKKVQRRARGGPPPGPLERGEDSPALCGQCWEPHTHISRFRRSVGRCPCLSSLAPPSPARRSKESQGSPGPWPTLTRPGSRLCTELGSRLCRLKTPHHFLTRDPKFITWPSKFAANPAPAKSCPTGAVRAPAQLSEPRSSRDQFSRQLRAASLLAWPSL